MACYLCVIRTLFVGYVGVYFKCFGAPRGVQRSIIFSKLFWSLFLNGGICFGFSCTVFDFSLPDVSSTQASAHSVFLRALTFGESNFPL